MLSKAEKVYFNEILREEIRLWVENVYRMVSMQTSFYEKVVVALNNPQFCRLAFKNVGREKSTQNFKNIADRIHSYIESDLIPTKKMSQIVWSLGPSRYFLYRILCHEINELRKDSVDVPSDYLEMKNKYLETIEVLRKYGHPIVIRLSKNAAESNLTPAEREDFAHRGLSYAAHTFDVDAFNERTQRYKKFGDYANNCIRGSLKHAKMEHNEFIYYPHISFDGYSKGVTEEIVPEAFLANDSPNTTPFIFFDSLEDRCLIFTEKELNPNIRMSPLTVPEDAVSRKEWINRLNKIAQEALTDLEYKVVKCRCGVLSGANSMDKHTIAEVLGIPWQMVRGILKETRKKLRKDPKYSELLDVITEPACKLIQKRDCKRRFHVPHLTTKRP